MNPVSVLQPPTVIRHLDIPYARQKNGLQFSRGGFQNIKTIISYEGGTVNFGTRAVLAAYIWIPGKTPLRQKAERLRDSPRETFSSNAMMILF